MSLGIWARKKGRKEKKAVTSLPPWRRPFDPKGLFFGIYKFKFYTKTDFFKFSRIFCVIWKIKGKSFKREEKLEKKTTKIILKNITMLQKKKHKNNDNKKKNDRKKEKKEKESFFFKKKTNKYV